MKKILILSGALLIAGVAMTGGPDGGKVSPPPQASVKHLVTIAGSTEELAGVPVINTQEYERVPSKTEIEDAIYKWGVVRYPLDLEKSACTDSVQCAGAIRDTCRALGSVDDTVVFRRLAKKGDECSGSCENGRKVRVTCVHG